MRLTSRRLLETELPLTRATRERERACGASHVRSRAPRYPRHAHYLLCPFLGWKSSRRYRAAYLINIRTSEVSVHKLFVTNVTAAIGLIRLGSVALGVLEVWTVWEWALLVRREELSALSCGLFD